MQGTRSPDIPAVTQPFSGGARGGAIMAKKACPFSSGKQKLPCTLQIGGTDMTHEKKRLNAVAVISLGPDPEHCLLRQESDTVTNRFQASPRRETLITHSSLMQRQDPFL